MAMAVIIEDPGVMTGVTGPAAYRHCAKAAAWDGRCFPRTVTIMTIGTETMDLVAGCTIDQGGYLAQAETAGGAMTTGGTGGQVINLLGMIDLGAVLMGTLPAQTMAGAAVTTAGGKTGGLGRGSDKTAIIIAGMAGCPTSGVMDLTTAYKRRGG